MITHRFPLAGYRDAFVAARAKRAHGAVKVIFDLKDEGSAA
jgi:threonine dehydrogenase-like Zn-dependent dehydrogenase